MLMPRSVDVVRFGDFELDARAFELRRNGTPVRLERRPMDLLIFLVERRGELVTRADIVGQLWGRDVFIEVEPAVNTAIKKVRRALDDSAEAPTFLETVPGRGYRFVAVVTEATAVAPSGAGVDRAAAPVARDGHWIWVAGAAVLLAVSTVAWQQWSGAQASTREPMRIAPLTTLTGMERGATFSPDGRQVAFTWSGDAQDNWDIHTKLIGSAEVRRLTSDANRDLAPKWSNDGRHIAYLRQEPSGEVEYLRVMSALGLSDRPVSVLNVLPGFSWSPDDRWIAIGVSGQSGRQAGIYLLPVNGGKPRQITQAPAGGVDWMTAFSPDGRHLAYGSCADVMNNCHVQLVALDAGFGVAESPRRLTAARVESIRGVTWSREGSSVIFGAIEGAASELWRLGITGDSQPRRIEMAGGNALFPATVPSRDVLAFTRSVIDQDVYALADGYPVQPIARSSVFDGYARLSPDGRRVAFCSDRTTDALEVWLSDSDGAHPEQLTRGPNRIQCSPAWAPDGRAIAFETRDANGESQIYAMDLDTRQPRPLTTGRGNRRSPSWSRDGARVYFSWDAGTGRDIWRVGRDGKMLERMTTTGSGLAVEEGIDGQTLFYLASGMAKRHDPTEAPLMAQPSGGGQAHEIIPCVRGTAFSVGARGISYLPCRSAQVPSGDPPVYLFDPGSGESRLLGTLDGYSDGSPSGFSASLDGRTFLYNRLVSQGEDLMLIENFR